MSKNDCIRIFNAMIRGQTVSFDEDLLNLYSDYLTENNIKNSDKLIYLIIQNPQLLQQALPVIVEYFCRKYNIFILKKLPNLEDINLLKTILYYE